MSYLDEGKVPFTNRITLVPSKSFCSTRGISSAFISLLRPFRLFDVSRFLGLNVIGHVATSTKLRCVICVNRGEKKEKGGKRGRGRGGEEINGALWRNRRTTSLFHRKLLALVFLKSLIPLIIGEKIREKRT